MQPAEQKKRKLDELGRVLRKDGKLAKSFVVGNAYGHERQCKAIARNCLIPRRCELFACAGREYCHFHGGKSHVGKRLIWKHGRVSIYYSKHLGQSLASAADHFASKIPLEAIQIHEEVAVTRAAATKALEFAAKVFETQGATDSTKAQACQLIMSVMAQVSQVVERAAKIEAMADDKVSVKSTVKLIEQIIRVLHEVLGDENNDVVKLIADRINAEVRIPLERVRGQRDDETTVGAFPIAIGVVNIQNNNNNSAVPYGVIPSDQQLLENTHVENSSEQ